MDSHPDSGSLIRQTPWARNATQLRRFFWVAALAALIPFWGGVFWLPEHFYVQVMLALWTTFAVFIMALGVTLYLQRQEDAVAWSYQLQRQAQQEARSRQDQMQALLAMNPDGVVAFDAQQRVQWVNPAFVRMTGVSESQWKGLDPSAFSATLAARCVAPAVFPGLEVLQQSMTKHRIELSGAGRFLLQVELVRASSAWGGMDSPLSMMLYFRDITFDSQLEQDKTDFLATAAHELRTPIASVYGFAEVLMMEDHDAASQREFLGIIYRQSQHMVTIINELLDLARLEARQAQDFVFARLRVQDAVTEVVKQFKLPPGREAPELRFPSEPVYIRGDAGKLNQALQNVLSNAYKFSPAGGSVQIGVQLHSQRQVSISIKDAGIGMTQNQVSKVFTRFYRADTVASLPGTGLGMNIVKEIMKFHAGDVLIDSALGVGTRVSLIIPVATE